MNFLTVKRQHCVRT